MFEYPNGECEPIYIYIIQKKINSKKSPIRTMFGFSNFVSEICDIQRTPTPKVISLVSVQTHLLAFHYIS
jgi:hypothetical protein